VFYDMQEIGPDDRVKSFENIQLYEKRKCFPLMKILDYLLHIHEVIMYTPPLDERCLVIGNQVV
jgi:hypothetical protein